MAREDAIFNDVEATVSVSRREVESAEGPIEVIMNASASTLGPLRDTEISTVVHTFTSSTKITAAYIRSSKIG